MDGSWMSVNATVARSVRRDDPPDGHRSGRLRTQQPFGADHETLHTSPALFSDGLARSRCAAEEETVNATVAASGFRIVRPDESRQAAAQGIVRRHSNIQISTRLSHRLPNDYPTVRWGRRLDSLTIGGERRRPTDG